jgi:unsaturated chondroitin disaccharide hydrolase
MPAPRLEASDRRAGALAAALAALFAVPGSAAADAALRARAETTLAFAETQLLDSVAEIDDSTRYPRSTSATTGLWITKPSSNWAAGFFPGQLWLVYEHGGNEALRTAAEQWTANLAGQATNTTTHDVGFMILSSFGHAYRISGDDAHRQTVLTAAGSLDSRFDPDVGATRSWSWGSWQFPVIVDNMMNLELLFWGARNCDAPCANSWFARAESHADVTIASHVRLDGSTYHVVDFDPATGAILSRETHQGYGAETTWARGQAWGLYSFTMTYRESGESRFLDAARNLADFFLANLPTDRVPYWDFDAPDIPNEPRDSSAAAIALSGLLELSTLETDPLRRDTYLAEAEAILDSLTSAAYLSDGAVSSGLLLHGTGNKPANKSVDVSLIYGDYYLVEAMVRYLEITAPVRVPALAYGAKWLVVLVLVSGAWVLRGHR